MNFLSYKIYIIILIRWFVMFYDHACIFKNLAASYT